MKKIFTEFTEASPLSKLSTLADIATILGVSVATFVAGPFLSEMSGLGFDASEFIIAILVYCFFAFILLNICIRPGKPT